MKTKTEIRKRARAIAEMHYYADVDGRQLWEPFEHYLADKMFGKEELVELIEDLATAFINF